MEENTQQEVQPTPVEDVEETYTPPAPITEEVVEVTASEEPVAQEQPASEAPKLKVGDRVRIFIDPPAGTPQEGTVRVVQDVPGKTLGVELDHFTDRCHALDGLVEERVDETRGVVVGKGWWTREENVEVLQ